MPSTLPTSHMYDAWVGSPNSFISGESMRESGSSRRKASSIRCTVISVKMMSATISDIFTCDTAHVAITSLKLLSASAPR